MDDGRELIPGKFSISDAARRQIEKELVSMAARSPGDWVVAMVWMVDEPDGGNPAPGLGFYERGDSGTPPIMNIDGLDVMFALSKQTKDHYEGKTLDFVDHRFVLK